MQGFPESVRDKLAVFFLKQQFPMTVKQINDAGRLEKPVHTPTRANKNRFMTVPAMPIAANSPVPAKRPMTNASMVL